METNKLRLKLTSNEHCTTGNSSKPWIRITNSKTQEYEYYFVEVEDCSN